jgi:hypothetical protein
MKKKFTDSRIYRILLMFYFFITVFFPLGFYTLLAGPTTWIIEIALKNSWSEYNEKLVQRFVIIGLIIISFILSILLTKLFLKRKSKLFRYSIAGAVLVIFLVSIYIFSFKPEIFIELSGKTANNKTECVLSGSGINVEFVFGAYPNLIELKRLKLAGYTGVVSLLNELVVPAEPNLISEEEQNAKLAGIPLVRIPMLPWVSGNNESIDLIHKLVKEGYGKYFVHCYLGRDRVNVFRNIVQDMGAKSTSLVTELARHIEDLKSFERGPYTKLADGVYLTPYPTDDEFFGYIVNGQVSTVVSLLDPEDKADTLWISHEKQILSRYGVRYVNLPVSGPRNALEMKILTDSFPKIKRPVIIHKYSSNDSIYKVIIKKMSTIKK